LQRAVRSPAKSATAAVATASNMRKRGHTSRLGSTWVVLLLGCLALADAPVVPGAARLLTIRQANVIQRRIDGPSASVSADGRYVAFVSFARSSAGVTIEAGDIYVLDLENGSISLETSAADGRLPVTGGSSPSISGDGRFLVYETSAFSSASTLPSVVIALRDRWRKTTDVIGGALAANGSCEHPRISADGRTIVFTSFATNLVSGADANQSRSDVYRFERETGTISRVSVDSAGRQSQVGASFAPAISDDGRYVAFVSSAPLDSAPAPDSPLTRSVYLRDTMRGVTERVSVGMHGAEPNGASYQPSLNGDGRWVAFTSDASNLAPRDSNHAADVFLYDRDARTTVLISRGRSGESANGRSTYPAISGDGRAVSFQSDASDLTCGRGCASSQGDVNLVSDVFLFDRASGGIQWLSRGRRPWMEPSIGPAIDRAGSVVTFSSRHPVDARDVNDDFDLYVRVDASRADARPNH